MEKRGTRLSPVIALLTLAIIGVLVSAYSEAPRTLSGIVLPSHVISDEAMIMANKDISDKTWHAYQKADGHEWYATRCLRATDGQKREEWTIRGLSTSGDPEKSWAFGSGFAVEDKAFYGRRSEQTLRNGGSPMNNIMAAGIINDPQVVKVVGTTANGRTASVTPMNTCWYLVLADIGVVDRWATVEALDADGSVLHTLTFGNIVAGRP